MKPHTQSSYRHQDIETTSFHDIHENESGWYGSLSEDNHGGKDYKENSQESIEDLDLEDRNLVNIPRHSADLIMALFESPAHRGPLIWKQFLHQNFSSIFHYMPTH